jgi:hypothetical protein
VALEDDGAAGGFDEGAGRGPAGLRGGVDRFGDAEGVEQAAGFADVGSQDDAVGFVDRPMLRGIVDLRFAIVDCLVVLFRDSARTEVRGSPVIGILEHLTIKYGG